MNKFLVGLTVVSVLFFVSVAGAGQKVTVSGSDTVYPVVKLAAPQFKTANPDVDVVVGAGGSSAGIEAVGSGKVEIGMASRDLKDAEKGKFADLVVTPIGKDGVVLVVNVKNTVTGLTKDQIEALYTGAAKSWKDVGGEDKPVELISLNGKHGTFEAFGHYFGLEIKETDKTGTFGKKGSGAVGSASAQLTNAHPETLAAIATKEGAIGFAPIGAALKFAEKSKRVKVITLDGKEPTIENVASGAYPLQRPLNVVTKGAPTGAVKLFIDYLAGKDGQALVQQADFVTIH